MADFLEINVADGLTKEAVAVEKLRQEFSARLRKELEPLRVFLEQRIKANVPYQTGNLESKTTVTVLIGEEIGFEVIMDTDYATEVHERPGEPDGSTPEGGRGPRFVPRVLTFHQEHIQKEIQAALSRIQE